jgi:hypothetical protein
MPATIWLTLHGRQGKKKLNGMISQKRSQSHNTGSDSVKLRKVWTSTAVSKYERENYWLIK